MTIHLEQSGNVNTIQTGTTSANSSADLRITNIGAGSTFMTFATSGSVGIGTTAPNGILTIGATSANVPFNINVQNSSGNIDVCIASANGQYSAGASAGDGVVRSFDKKLHLVSGSTNLGICIGTSGNIGIGTTAPTTQLTIKKTIDSQAYGSGTRVMDFKTPYGNGVDEETVKAAIYCGIPGVGSLRTDHGYLSFMTANTNTLYERLRIDQEGNIGIGTTAPSAKLQVNATNIAIVAQDNASEGWTGRILSKNATSDRAVFLGTANGNSIIASHNNALNAWASLFINTTNGTTDGGNVIIAGNQNVSIGTSTPSTRLHVVGSGSGTNGSVLITGTDAFGHSLYIGGAAAEKRLAFNNNGTTGNIFAYNYGSSASQSLVLQGPGGNVGIGTGTPRQALDVTGSIITDWADNRFIGMQYIDGTLYRMGMTMFSSTRNLNLIAMSGDNTGSITFNTGPTPTERMRVTADGNLLVGTPNHSYFAGNKLTVRSDCTDGQTSQILIQGLTDARKTAQIGYDTTNNYAFIDSLNHQVAWTNTIFSRNGGNVGIGTTNPGSKLDVQGDISRWTYSNDNHSAVPRFTHYIGKTDFANGYAEFCGMGCRVVDAATSGEGASNHSWVSFYTWGNAISGWREACRVDQRGRVYNLSGTYGTLSDINIKENIETARDYLNDVLNLRVVKYSLKSEHQPEADKLGFIAQEVETVFPNLVNTQSYTFKDENGQDEEQQVKMVKTSVLLPMAIKCIQELNTKLQEKDQELATLKQFLQNKFPGEL
jgi:hypothetical protein